MGEQNRAGRPQQPRCAVDALGCGKALYKRMDSGTVRPDDSYAWCRNQGCAHYNIPQAKSRFHPIAQVKLTPVVEPVPVSKKSAVKPKAKPKGDLGQLSKLIDSAPTLLAPTENAVVLTARERIQQVIAGVEQAYSRNIIGLALAIVAQELGSYDAANKLIEEYKLQELYGILPRTTK